MGKVLTKEKSFPQLIMAAVRQKLGLKLSPVQVREISEKQSIREAALICDKIDDSRPVRKVKLSLRPGGCAIYTLRVDVVYDGVGEKPDAHVLRKWLLDCMLNGRRPPCVAVGHEMVRGKKKFSANNVVTLSVRCVGCS